MLSGIPLWKSLDGSQTSDALYRVSTQVLRKYVDGCYHVVITSARWEIGYVPLEYILWTKVPFETFGCFSSQKIVVDSFGLDACLTVTNPFFNLISDTWVVEFLPGFRNHFCNTRIVRVTTLHGSEELLEELC